MSELEIIAFKNRNEFREWLINNNKTHQGIWLVFYKKCTNKESITYEEALEEALCFGWIDSIIKRIDDEKYMRKFTPRRDKSKWSDYNITKIKELIRKGLMTEAGLEKTDNSIFEDSNIPERNKKETFPDKMPEYVIDEFKKNEPAYTNYINMTRTCRKQYILWIVTAKKEETIKKRITESIKLLKENKKLGLK